jgi:hypothetical protein
LESKSQTSIQPKSSKAILVAVTIVAIFLVVVLAIATSYKLPTPSPTPTPAKEWHPIANFTGTGDKTTSLFYIPSNQFRIIYGANPDDQAVQYGIGGDLYFFIYPKGETLMYVEYVSMTSIMETKADLTYVYHGPGSFYIKVIAANLDLWLIKVEAYY